MAIVAIISSPRKGANTDTLVNAIADSAKENGKEVKTFYLNSLKDRKGCQGCMGCKKAGHCVVKDDMTPVIDAIRDAEGIILSTPVYFGRACSQYISMEDRFFGFLNGDFSLNIAPGKKVAIVTSAGSAGADALADTIEKTMAGFFKCECVGKIFLNNGNPPNVAAGDADLIAQAKAIGKKF